MAPASVHIKQTKNRRRKKRRTEDFSSDSDSDSSSSSGDESGLKPEQSEEPKGHQPQQQVSIDDMDVESDAEAKDENEDLQLSKEIQEKVDSIKFTSTQNQSLAEAKRSVQKDRQELESQYLAYMATTFSDDLDQLRKKPDFTSNSIVLLAKTLQSGSNMFDSETLDALIKE